METGWHRVITRYSPALDQLKGRPLKQQQSILRSFIFDDKVSDTQDRDNRLIILQDLWRNSLSHDRLRVVGHLIDKFLSGVPESPAILQILEETLAQKSDTFLFSERLAVMPEFPIFYRCITAHKSIRNELLENALDVFESFSGSESCSQKVDNTRLKHSLSALLAIDRCYTATDGPPPELLARYRAALERVIDGSSVMISFDCRQLATVGWVRFIQGPADVASYFAVSRYSVDLSGSLMIARALLSKRHHFVVQNNGDSSAAAAAFHILRMIWDMLQWSMLNLPDNIALRLSLFDLLQIWLEFVQSEYPFLLETANGQASDYSSNYDDNNNDRAHFSSIYGLYFKWILQYLDDTVVSVRVRLILESIMRVGGPELCRDVYKYHISLVDDCPNKYRILSVACRSLSSGDLLDVGGESITESWKLFRTKRLAPFIADYYLQLLLVFLKSTQDNVPDRENPVYLAVCKALLYPERSVREVLAERGLKQLCRLLRDNPTAIGRCFSGLQACLSPSDPYYMHAVVLLAKLAKPFSTSNSNVGTMLNVSTLFSVNYTLLMDCLRDADSNLRCDALGLLIDSNKTFGDISEQALDGALVFLREGLAYEGQVEYRRRCISTFHRFMDRMAATLSRHSCSENSNQTSLELTVAQIGRFFVNFGEWMPYGFYPNVPYQIASVHSDLLLKFLNCFQRFKPIYESVINATLFDRLLWMLMNNFSGMRQTVFNILEKIEDIHEWKKRSFSLQNLHIDGDRLIKGFKASEAECGAMIKYLLSGKCDQYQSVINELNRNLVVAKDLNSLDGAPCGHLILVRLILERLPEAGVKDFDALFGLISGFCDLVMPLLTNQAPEGARLNDLEDFEENDDYDADAEVINPSGSNESQIMASISWRIVKHCCELLQILADRRLKHPAAAVDKSTIEKVAKLTHKMLENIRHCGAFHAVYPIYNTLCQRIVQIKEISGMIGDNIATMDGKWLLSKWLDEHLCELESRRVSVTRRSAGLPFLILSVVTAECLLRSTSIASADWSTPAKDKQKQSAQISRRQLLSRTMEQILDVAGRPASRQDIEENSTDLVQVHAFNVINVLVKDTKISSHTQRYVESAMILAVEGFNSACWAIRNCSTMLYASLFKRIIGPTPSSRLEIQSFYSDYPALFQHICLILRQTKNGGLKCQSLFPAICLLSKLCTNSATEILEEAKEMTENLLYVATKSRSEYIRTIAAQSIVTVNMCASTALSPSDLFTILQQPSDDYNQTIGLLTVLRELLTHVSAPLTTDNHPEQGDNPSACLQDFCMTSVSRNPSVIVDLVAECENGRLNWLLFHPKHPIRSLYYQILFKTVIEPVLCLPVMFNPQLPESVYQSVKAMAERVAAIRDYDYTGASSQSHFYLHEKFQLLISMGLIQVDYQKLGMDDWWSHAPSYESQVAVLEYLRTTRLFTRFADGEKFLSHLVNYCCRIMDSINANGISRWKIDSGRLVLKSCLALIIEMFKISFVSPAGSGCAEICLRLLLNNNNNNNNQLLDGSTNLNVIVIEMLGYVVAAMQNDETAINNVILDSWLQTIDSFSQETMPLALRRACVHSLKPVIGHGRGDTFISQFPPQVTCLIFITCLARRLLQDDEEQIREDSALLVSQTFPISDENCSTARPQRPRLCPGPAVRFLFRHIARKITDDHRGLVIQCMIDVLQDADQRLTAITGLKKGGQLFNHEKANVVKDECLDSQLAVEVLRGQLESSKHRPKDFSNYAAQLHSRICEVQDASSETDNDDHQMNSLRYQLLQAAANLFTRSSSNS